MGKGAAEGKREAERWGRDRDRQRSRKRKIKREKRRKGGRGRERKWARTTFNVHRR